MARRVALHWLLLWLTRDGVLHAAGAMDEGFLIVATGCGSHAA